MKSKYKNGLVLGKFFPLHLGHKYLIDTAIENCEHTHVIISHNKKQSIPGEVRFNAIEELYKDNPNVTVYNFSDDNFPQYDYECETLDEFYSYWVPAVYNLVKELDVVFTSESYGDEFAQYLGIEHYLVDKERVKYPISGTEVRNNPFDKWNFITEQIQPFFVKKIVLMGPESVGKSTITEKLAKYFNTNFVHEYGRTVYEENGNQVTVKDFIPISIGRQKLEDDAIKHSNKLLFSDTEDITTYLFLKMYCDGNYENEEKWFLERLKTVKRHDLYILLSPDCEGVQDGTRHFLEERNVHYKEIKKQLINYNCNFVEIGGDWDNRFNECIRNIKNKFNV